jgi:hypothetical protein
MRLALATCSGLPDWEVDDRPFHRALEARGVDVSLPAWDAPSFPWSEQDACLIRTTWDYMERREEFVAWAERVERQTRLLHPAAVVRWNTHKGYLREVEAAGIPVVPTVWLRPGDRPELASLLEETVWERAFCKPAVGATARETRRFTRSQAEVRAAQEHLGRLLAAGEEVLLQPYLSSVERHGEVSAVAIADAALRGVRKIPVPGDYRVQDDFGAHDEPFDLPDEVVRSATRAFAFAAERLGVDLLYGRADFLRDDEGVYRLTELELVEPSLFFRHDPGSAEILAEALLARLA